MSFSDYDNINSKLADLPPFQRAQIDTHVNGYRAQLAQSKPPMLPHSIESLVREFRKTLVTQIH